MEIGNKFEEQRKTMANINMLFNGRNNALEIFNGYTSMMLQGRNRSAKWKRTQNVTIQTNATKINNSIPASKSN